MDINTLRTDSSLENDGVWIDGPDGSRFKIRSSESTRYRAKLASLTRRENPMKIRKDPKRQQALTVEAMASEILLDWEGVNDGGQPLHCTLENRITILGFPEIRDLIAIEAQDLANFRSEALAADADDIKSRD